MWVAAFAGPEELAEYVHEPEKFIENRAKTVIGTNDQVPVWIYLAAPKQLYHESEVGRNTQKLSNVHQESQSVRDMIAIEGMTQKRAQEESGADKYRITVDLHTVLEGVFDPEFGEPVGDMIETVVVVPGQYLGSIQA